MATITATTANFETLIDQREIVIIDFWAPWCGPCRSFAPTFDAASEKYTDVAFVKVNTDEQQELAAEFQIRSIPTLMLFREKILLFAQPGVLPASALDNLIEQAKALDMDQVRREIAERGEGEQPA